tara:strand:+ start:287 stop:1306 length:1020 start_codon:yes stop_codon:yes gene_type:complete
MSKVHKEIPINEVFFDISNPRIKYVNPWKEGDDSQMQDQAIPSLLKDPSESSKYTYGSLKASIKAAGTIVNPIWVKMVDDRLVCIEGNTRLCVYRDLYNDENEDKANWEKIPAIVYENLTDEEEHKLKLTAHVVGTREWTPYSRACYVNELLEGTFDWDQIVNIVGGRRNQLANLAQAQVDFDKYYFKKYDEVDEKKFSYFIEATERNFFDKIKEFGFNEEDYADWVYKGKFKRAINTRYLPKILANEEAKSAFINGDFDDAYPFIVGEPVTDLSSVPINSLISEVLKRIDNLRDEDNFYEDEELIKKLVLLSSSVREALVSLPDQELEKHFATNKDNS